MKIFQAVYNPYEALTPYMHTFMTCISSQYGDVKWGWGPEKIWTAEIFTYEIIHVHWPDLLLCNHTPQELEKRIKEIKSKKIVVLCTCHNLVPHYCNNPQRIKAYNIVYSLSDYMIHLGSYSLNIQKKIFPTTKHVYLPHHVYNNVYRNFYTKKESCSKLGISSSSTNIICFGTFRSNEERLLVKKVAKELKKENVCIIAPNFWGVPQQGRLNKIQAYLKIFFYKKTYRIITNYKDSVSDKDLPLYYGASDIAFIQRLKILNSGTVPMAFLMGKAVVGPNEGNVSEILKETKNFIFDTQSFSSVIQTLKDALHSNYLQIGVQNHNYAMQFLSTERISQQLHNLYLHIATEKTPPRDLQ